MNLVSFAILRIWERKDANNRLKKRKNPLNLINEAGPGNPGPAFRQNVLEYQSEAQRGAESTVLAPVESDLQRARDGLAAELQSYGGLAEILLEQILEIIAVAQMCDLQGQIVDVAELPAEVRPAHQGEALHQVERGPVAEERDLVLHIASGQRAAGGHHVHQVHHPVVA